MKKLSALGILIVIVVFCCVSCGDTLSREKAEKIIREKRFANLPYVTIPIQLSDTMFACQPGSIFSTNDFGDFFGNYTALSQQGYIELKPIGQRVAGGTLTCPAYQATVTEKGKQFFLDPKPFFQGSDRKIYQAQMCKKEFVGVTGIVLSENKNSATVEYTWKYTSFTPVFDLLQALANRNHKPPITKDQTYPDRAVFTKYDDGWRLSEK